MSTGYQINNQQGVYYLTFQVVGWADIFTRKVYRDLVVESLEYCRTSKGLKIHAYVFMSNHIHCILSTPNELSAIIRDFKKHTSKTILAQIAAHGESRREWLQMVFKYHAKFNTRNANYQFWTHDNHAVELLDNNLIETRLNYIHQNPVRAGIVANDYEYLYSSARCFANLDCVLKIDSL